jgi:methylphosphotriester-DNA--protein-cysteine methyltransferase
MILHIHLLDSDVKKKIRNHEIVLGGNKKLKIYGLLSCKSGKRMSKENRVFFSSEFEAQQNNYRPCAHCLYALYLKWKNDFV